MRHYAHTKLDISCIKVVCTTDLYILYLDASLANQATAEDVTVKDNNRSNSHVHCRIGVPPFRSRQSLRMTDPINIHQNRP